MAQEFLRRDIGCERSFTTFCFALPENHCERNTARTALPKSMGTPVHDFSEIAVPDLLPVRELPKILSWNFRNTQRDPIDARCAVVRTTTVVEFLDELARVTLSHRV